MSEEPSVSGEQTMEAAAPLSFVQNDSSQEQGSREQYVPLTALQSERAQRQKMEEELRIIRDHLTLIQANQTRPQEQPKDDFEGLNDGDVMTVGDFKKIANKFNQQVTMSVEELRMTQKYPDYQEVVTKYLPEVLKTNPGLRNSLVQTQDFELAYYLARNSEIYKSENKRVKRSADAERIVQNSQLSGSLTSMGQSTPVSMTKRYKDMSDADFVKEVNKNLGYS